MQLRTLVISALRKPSLEDHKDEASLAYNISSEIAWAT